jgi:putative PIN family toxin of toxin-antitoxin system
VLVSAVLKRSGAEAAILLAVSDKRLTWCVSPAILAEYEEVLHRPKFSHLPETYVGALLALAGEAELFEPTFTLQESPHEPDNRFLECAEAAEANYLVTGNARHFPKHWKRTAIVNAQQLLQALESAP